MIKENFVNKIIPHDSAYKHVSGFAEYTDDIKEPKDTLYGAIGLSKKAHAIIRKIDLNKVKSSEGVISVITYQDIPGRNDVGPVFDGDPIFPEKKIEFYGQPLFAVAATSIDTTSSRVCVAVLYSMPPRMAIAAATERPSSAGDAGDSGKSKKTGNPGNLGNPGILAK